MLKDFDFCNILPYNLYQEPAITYTFKLFLLHNRQVMAEDQLGAYHV